LHLGRRGLSNVIAVMLLILISTTGAAILYAYASGIFGSLQGGQPQQSYLEHIALEYYNWTNPSLLQIRVRNVGSANILIKDVFISGTIVTANTTYLGVPPDQCQNPGSLPVQSSCLVQIVPPNGLILSFFQPGTAYSVTFVSSTGGKTSFSVVYEQSG
jgi:hypothetical protein